MITDSLQARIQGGGTGAKAPGLSKWRPRAPKRRRDKGFAGVW